MDDYEGSIDSLAVCADINLPFGSKWLRRVRLVESDDPAGTA
jgi:hypothetical protein